MPLPWLLGTDAPGAKSQVMVWSGWSELLTDSRAGSSGRRKLMGHRSSEY